MHTVRNALQSMLDSIWQDSQECAVKSNELMTSRDQQPMFIYGVRLRE
jgi:hypothetical protein